VPPRFAYWTILAGGLPTAFRAVHREELAPTFHRLKEKHPDAVMKWFARGRLWDSPDDARAALERQRGDRGQTRRGSDERGETRNRDWRPGGSHRDPRQRFADAKKARNLDRRKQRFERREQEGRGGDRKRRDKPGGTRDRNARAPWENRGGGKNARDGAPLRHGGAATARSGNGGQFRPKRKSDRPHGSWRDRHTAGPKQSPGGNRRRDERVRTPPRSRAVERPDFTRRRRDDELTPPDPGPPRREPRRSEDPAPTPPPQPSEPVITPPGPPERGKRRGGFRR
jgi:hypothetical protein